MKVFFCGNPENAPENQRSTHSSPRKARILHSRHVAASSSAAAFGLVALEGVELGLLAAMGLLIWLFAVD
ncbi:MAG: hypothetical protein JW999_00140 [Methanotrichaceae archaeon]|nr:hypothetical protein [Methanotrichaceae archaeon]